MADSADYYNTFLHIKQDSIITHAQAKPGLGFVQALDVPMQPLLQSFNLPNDLSAFASRQIVEVFQGRKTVLDLIMPAIHGFKLQFALAPGQKNWPETRS